MRSGRSWRKPGITHPSKSTPPTWTRWPNISSASCGPGMKGKPMVGHCVLAPVKLFLEPLSVHHPIPNLYPHAKLHPVAFHLFLPYYIKIKYKEYDSKPRGAAENDAHHCSWAAKEFSLAICGVRYPCPEKFFPLVRCRLHGGAGFQPAQTFLDNYILGAEGGHANAQSISRNGSLS